MPRPSSTVTPSSLCPGTVVSVWVFPFFRHRGIVSDRFCGDKPMVISNSARAKGVAEEPWEVFAAGQEVAVEGYPGSLPTFVVIHRVRALIGVPYDLFRWNCDHLTTYAHGLEPNSPQLAFVTAVAVVVGVIAIAGNS